MQTPLQRRRSVPEANGAMTLRITTISSKNKTTIRVEGHLMEKMTRDQLGKTMERIC